MIANTTKRKRETERERERDCLLSNRSTSQNIPVGFLYGEVTEWRHRKRRIERILLFICPKRRGYALHLGLLWRAPDLVTMQKGQKEITTNGPYCVFWGNAKKSKKNVLGLASLNDVGRLWSLGVIFSCLVPGTGWLEQKS